MVTEGSFNEHSVSYIYLWYKTKQRFQAEEFQIPPHRQALSLAVIVKRNPTNINFPTILPLTKYFKKICVAK
jgi:hypothetical protein